MQDNENIACFSIMQVNRKVTRENANEITTFVNKVY